MDTDTGGGHTIIYTGTVKDPALIMAPGCIPVLHTSTGIDTSTGT